MADWLWNWLFVGLLINWIGLQIQKTKPTPTPYHWIWDVVAVIIWPIALSLGILAGIIASRKGRK